jgi:ATP-binding protein involved in chromosome partitioning
MDLFKTGGGMKESERLGVPLLGKIPISADIMTATDSGTPIAESSPESPIGKIYHQIAQSLLSTID